MTKETLDKKDFEIIDEAREINKEPCEACEDDQCLSPNKVDHFKHTCGVDNSCLACENEASGSRVISQHVCGKEDVCSHCQYEKGHSPECPLYKKKTFEEFCKEPKPSWEEFEKSEAGKAFRCLLLEIPEIIHRDVKEKTLDFIRQTILKEREQAVEEGYKKGLKEGLDMDKIK